MGGVGKDSRLVVVMKGIQIYNGSNIVVEVVVVMKLV